MVSWKQIQPEIPIGFSDGATNDWPETSMAARAAQQADAIGDWEASLLARTVAEHFDVTFEELFHHSRSRAPIATTRQIAMYLMHVLMGRTLTEVGEFYRRDRTTVSHACGRIEDLRDDAAFDDDLTKLEDQIWQRLSCHSGDLQAEVPEGVVANNDDQ